ncbi:hypothetical protein J3F83DRAFT_344752 [Trichoderma novae-zelandiae]
METHRVKWARTCPRLRVAVACGQLAPLACLLTTLAETPPEPDRPRTCLLQLAFFLLLALLLFPALRSRSLFCCVAWCPCAASPLRAGILRPRLGSSNSFVEPQGCRCRCRCLCLCLCRAPSIAPSVRLPTRRSRT